MAKRNVDLTSKAWRDIVFEGKNKDFGAYDLRQKSEKRHTLAVIFTLVGLALIVVGVIAWVKVSNYMEEQRLARLAEEREKMSQVELAQDLEEVPEEKEEEKYKEPEPEIQEKEEVAQTQQTQIAIVPPEKIKEENVIKDVRDLLNDDAMRGKTNVESDNKTLEVSHDKAADKPLPPEPPAPKPEPEPVKPAPVEQPPAPDKVFDVVEQAPSFIGGDAKMYAWLTKNLRYPEIAQQNGIQGRVIVQFVVEKDGSISGVAVAKGIDKDLDREAIRVVKSMPKWQPGKNNGQPVRAKYTLPVMFKLQNQ